MKINLIFFLPTFVFGGAGNSIYRLCSKLNKKNIIYTLFQLENVITSKSLKNIVDTFSN